MARRVKGSKKHQITIPAEVRKQLRISSGDHLLVEVQDGMIVLIPEPDNYAERLLGLHSEIWEGVDAQEYIDQERESWRSWLTPRPSRGTVIRDDSSL